MPGHQLHEPSPFCRSFSFLAVSVMRLFIMFSSKKSARRSFCSLSRSASATQGVSCSSMSFSSGFFSNWLVSEPSAGDSSFQRLNTFLMLSLC